MILGAVSCNLSSTSKSIVNYQLSIIMIFVAESAKEKIAEIFKTENISGGDYFVRVSVVSGGCSGLSYKMDFDNQSKPNDQVFEDNGVKVVTDLKSFLYLFNTILEFSGGLDGKGFQFNNPNAARTCGCGESFAV
jgi:iron-sulfur cluster assembly protein